MITPEQQTALNAAVASDPRFEELYFEATHGELTIDGRLSVDDLIALSNLVQTVIGTHT